MHECGFARARARSLSPSLSLTQQSKDMMRECGATLLLGDSHTLKELGKDVDPSMPPVYISLVTFCVCGFFWYTLKEIGKDVG